MLDYLLLALRILSAVLLLVFVVSLAWLIWRDLRLSAQATQRERRTYGRLIVLAKTESDYLPTGQAYPLLPLTSIGRAPGNSIILNQSYASGEHALIAYRSNQWWLEDRNSRNGTLLNGDKISGPTILTEGDIVGIGDVYLRLSLANE